MEGGFQKENLKACVLDESNLFLGATNIKRKLSLSDKNLI